MVHAYLADFRTVLVNKNELYHNENEEEQIGLGQNLIRVHQKFLFSVTSRRADHKYIHPNPTKSFVSSPQV